MSRDHFVAQTYLKHWADPTTNKLQAYRKDGGEPFLCGKRDVCFEWDGDANPRFKNPRLVGEFRKIFEPGWNPAIGAIRNGALSATDKFMLAGLWAQLTTFTPAWQRNALTVYEHSLDSVLPILAQRVAAKHPESKKHIEQAIAEGRIHSTVEPDFVKQVLTQQLTVFTIALYEQDWTVIENPTDVRFITSDNPSSVFPDRPLNAPVVRFLPLAPDLGIMSVINRDRVTENADFPDLTKPPPGTIMRGQATREKAKELNRVVVMNADRFVFSEKPDVAIRRLTESHRDFGIDIEKIHFPTPDGCFIGASVAVRKKRAA